MFRMKNEIDRNAGDCMYDLNDTIVAVSSVCRGHRVIVRLSGPAAFRTCGAIVGGRIEWKADSVVPAKVRVADGLTLDCMLYVFVGPRSYTGEDIVEIHLRANDAVCEALIETIIESGDGDVRTAGPGEFTARAYLNNKIDLAQAEAVAEVISSSNRYQLAAAEKLLSGSLSRTIERVRRQITESLSLIEAGLDFSEEQIEFISREDALDRLGAIADGLEELLTGSIQYESVVSLPSVGIAGSPNAGKSTLLNRLLGRQRSIVSPQRKTTRDVLTGVLELEHSRCVIFDCAGLLCEPEGVLDELAQTAAVEALRHARAAVFCVDASNDNMAEDKAVRSLIRSPQVIPIAAKCDLLDQDRLESRLSSLKRTFDTDFLPVSSETGSGLEQLRDMIDRRIIAACSPAAARTATDTVALTMRHRRTVNDALESIKTAGEQVSLGNEEIAAMMLRAANQSLSDIEQKPDALDEAVLDQIFSRFCIGK